MARFRTSFMARVSIANWHPQFLDALEGLMNRTGEPIAECAVREQRQGVPRNYVFIVMDRNNPARAIVLCNPLDREAVEARMQEPASQARLIAVEPVPGTTN